MFGIICHLPGCFAFYAVVYLLPELYQRVAFSGARRRSDFSWLGMPTASVKSKHFLN
jgi:hypothetical protein